VRDVRALPVAALCVAMVSQSAPAVALDVRVMQLRVAGTRLWAAIELRDLLRDKFLDFVRDGRAVFVQLQADLWEDRRVFDRVVITTPAVTYRIDRDTDGRSVVILDEYGASTRHTDMRQPIPLRLDLGPADRLEDGQRYYLHAVITAATVDEREIEQAGEAIFGEEQSVRGLAALGRFVFRTLLRVGKYFESAEAEATSRRVSGRDIRAGAF
jgi:hypothetical protein